VWCSPSFILLSLVAAWDTLREDAADGALMSLKQLAWYGLVVLFFYLIVGGTAYSFPKYHFAILPIFSILIAVYLSKEISFNRQVFRRSAVVVLVFLIYGVFIVKDPLYLINYALKENIVLAGGASQYKIVFKAVMQFILSVLAIPIGFLLFRWLKEKKALLLSLGVTIIGLNLALSLVQSKAAYNTVYCYGAKGVKEAADFVRTHTNIKEPISAPPEIIWLANDNVSSYVISKPDNLKSPEIFLRTVRESHVQCVVYGITGNTLGQYRFVLNSDQVQRFLENGYIRHSIGSYTIWIKKI
jgi:hypothetical protein